MAKSLCISVVSHAHGEMVVKLVERLLTFGMISELILTLNIPEDFPNLSDSRLTIIRNDHPQGFGMNHNKAFRLSKSDFFCVMNPDILLIENPFPELFDVLHDTSVGLVAPLVVSTDGKPEDSMRFFISPLNMLKRIVGLNCGVYKVELGGNDLFPDWIAGMFMLFRSEVYASVGGFDERYFMYCEDADISTRLWEAGYKIVGCMSCSVIHYGQRTSHRSLRYLIWHIRSLFLYMLSHAFSLPNKEVVIKSNRGPGAH
jgi:GT2 family glycosyltransferase